MRNVAPIFTAAAAVFALAATGCSSLVPFTAELRAEHRLTDQEVKDLQFYSSHEITLRREVESQDRQITPGHKLRLVSGKSVEEVVIPARTPGVAVGVSSTSIAVSFVSGTSLEFVVGNPGYAVGDGRDLLEPALGRAEAALAGPVREHRKHSTPFLGQYADPPGGRGGPVKIAGGDPRPVEASYTGNYYIAFGGSGRVSFGGLWWEAVEKTAKAHLMIDADKLEETEERRTVLPGVRLGN